MNKKIIINKSSSLKLKNSGSSVFKKKSSQNIYKIQSHGSQYEKQIRKTTSNFKELSVGQTVRTKNSSFKVIEELAVGRCCEVYIGQDMSSLTRRAVKVFMKHQNYEGALARELKFLSQLAPHPNIVSHKEYVKVDGSDILIHELLSKTVKDIEVFLLESHRHASLYLIKQLAIDLMKALHHLKNCRIVHGDLKPQNIMWCAETEVFKLIDFGVSFSTKEKMKHPIQSRAFQAPETIKWNQWLATNSCSKVESGAVEVDRPSNAADVWGGGCIVAELIFGKKLYQFGWNGEDVCSTVESRLKALDGIHSNSNLTLMHMWLTKSMNVDVKERATAEDLLGKPFWPREDIKPKIFDLLLLPTKVLCLIGFFKPEFQTRETELLNELLGIVLSDYRCLHKVNADSGSLFLLFESSQLSMQAFQTLRKTCIKGYAITPSYFPYMGWCNPDYCL